VTDPLERETGRRAFLAVLGGALLGGPALVGCSRQDAAGDTGAGGGVTRSAPSSGPSTRAPSPGPPSGSTSGPPLPGVTRWSPSAGDVAPACKAAAVRHVERLGSSRRSRLQVLEAQYGGYLVTTASVLVVTRSWRLMRGHVVIDGHTYDVRLSRTAGGRWAVTAVHPSRAGPPGRPTAAARRVLASDRIDLPPAGRADVASGQVHDSALLAMLGVSGAHRIGVSVVRSGHPLHVFGTTRLSDHPQGRAFDTWRVDGRAVVDPDTPSRLVTAYMRALAGEGSYNVGGPYLLGSAPQWFSDATHHDHVHAGFVA
jgi:hypothetical protein